MLKHRVKAVLGLIAAMLFLAAPVSGCAQAPDFEYRLQDIVRQYRFSILDWEGRALFQGITRLVRPTGDTGGVEVVLEYFAAAQKINNVNALLKSASKTERAGRALESELEVLQQQNAVRADNVAAILAGQIRQVLAEEGILNPVVPGLRIHFPPLNFRLETPPRLLVVSPRERIDSIREMTLRHDISLEEVERMEGQVDQLGVSSLVVELGGFAGTYPSLVSGGANLRFTINAATEEWLHQYLVFRPLGFRYVLDRTGIARDYEIATMNETVVGIISKEIGSLVYAKYYGGIGEEAGSANRPEPGFDFNREMRDIRKTVDIFLSEGRIEQAEAYLEEQRQYLAAHGYYLRKLNQAYFAFHGTYADTPASVNPIGNEMKQLRTQSNSLRDFLETAASLTSRLDLQERLKQVVPDE